MITIERKCSPAADWQRPDRTQAVKAAAAAAAADNNANAPPIAGTCATGWFLRGCLTNALLGILWFGILVAATRPLTKWLSRPAVTRGLDRMTGAVFIAFGLKLALEKR